MARPVMPPDERVVRLYQQGLTAAEISEELNVSESTVFRHLRKAGVQSRPRSWRPRELREGATSCRS